MKVSSFTQYTPAVIELCPTDLKMTAVKIFLPVLMIQGFGMIEGYSPPMKVETILHFNSCDEMNVPISQILFVQGSNYIRVEISTLPLRRARNKETTSAYKKSTVKAMIEGKTEFETSYAGIGIFSWSFGSTMMTSLRRNTHRSEPLLNKLC
ncbi:hypothetical protein CANCADRAFT_111225 [Tortispora caseinolytica NRRL Y-17796]|uniref:Uncharacterized protein n=1 Tax=Tortispora caseinolytica NRRL Y-17796 TaxID=767744 RepID=A0A1E4TGB9_9ASCO|nr:hypothetical protein CANCADRAFT_111225 [Tortispora caseinolytica NRRL Y-17796]